MSERASERARATEARRSGFHSRLKSWLLYARSGDLYAALRKLFRILCPTLPGSSFLFGFARRDKDPGGGILFHEHGFQKPVFAERTRSSTRLSNVDRNATFSGKMNGIVRLCLSR